MYFAKTFVPSIMSISNHKESLPTLLIVQKNYFQGKLEDRIRYGNEIYNRKIQTRQQLEEVHKTFADWDNYNSELLKQSFNYEENEHKNGYDKIKIFSDIFKEPEQNRLKLIKLQIRSKIDFLERLTAKVDLIKLSVTTEIVSLKTQPDFGDLINRNVFIVHGHNNELKVAVARTIEKLGLYPIILQEQPNAGKTIIEKFENYSSSGFAIILLSDDDIGKSEREKNLKHRARQNVIFEFGYFIGKLGRNKVCAIYMKDVELPSDLYGLSYIEFDHGEYWKISMAKELKASGYNIDINKII